MNDNNVNSVNQNSEVNVNEQNTLQNQTTVPVNAEVNAKQEASAQEPINQTPQETNTTSTETVSNDNLTVQSNVNNTSASKLRIGGKKVTYSLDEKGNVVNNQSTNKKESKSAITFIIIFFGLLLVVVFAIPTFYQNLHNTNLRTKQAEETEDTYNLVDGKYIELGTKAHITDKKSKIKFNNFKKETQRAGIQFDVKAESSVSNVSDYNIAIKVYDKDKNLLHISYFAPTNKVETSVKRYYIHLSEDAYNIAYYVEVTVYDNNEKDTLECKTTRTSSGVAVNETIKYNFVGKMLSSYTYTKEATTSDGNTSLDSYINRYKEEYNNLLLTNINSNEITVDGAKITYTIDLSTFKKQTSTYDVLYEYGDVYDFIKKNETANDRTCK